MLILKIFRPEEWAVMQRDGATSGAPIDVADGFVHFSTPAQVAETAARYFAEVPDLILVAVQADTLGEDLTWETSRGGDLFPHLYRDFRMSDVLWSAPLPWEGGRHIFPDLAE